MSKVSATYDEEVDLVSLIQTIWDGKWKIVSIIAISLLLVLAFNIVIPNKTITATTQIKPITSYEFDRYKLFNSSLLVIKKEVKKDNEDIKDKVDKSFNIFEITQKSLLDLYLEQIEEGSLLETAIDKFELINEDDFDNKNNYKEAVEKFASEIRILEPVKEKNKIRSYHVLKAEYHDKKKWKALLEFVNNEANRRVKAAIINRFTTIVSIQSQKKDFALKDVEIEIVNVKADYDKNIKYRLAFLTEQATIARKLDIQKNTISSQRFNTQNTFVTNVRTDAPFYLRGYLAIEEEISLIKNRKNKHAFNKGLEKLAQKKRKLEQDATLDRAIYLFSKTPLNQTDFKAVLVKFATTDFKVKYQYTFYVIAAVLGAMIGVIYVLIAKAFKIRESNRVNS